MASPYLDLQLDEGELLEYRSHLSICAGCRDHLAETRQLSLLIKNRRQPEIPREFHRDIMSSIERRASIEMSFQRRMSEWLLRLNPMPVSYVAGAVISALLFTFTLLGFKPIPVIGAANDRAVVIPVITSSYLQYQSYNSLPADAATVGSTPYYELPRVLNDGALVSFSHLAQGNLNNESLSALVEVGIDGRARLVEMIDDPQDPRLVEDLWWLLNKPTFQPAIVRGRAVSTRIVLFVEQVDISG